MTVELAPIRVSLHHEAIQGPIRGMYVFVWRIIQTGGPVDALGPIDIGAGRSSPFFEYHEAEAFAKKQGWLIDD